MRDWKNMAWMHMLQNLCSSLIFRRFSPSVRFLTTAIASEMSYAAYGSLQRNALYSIGLVLFLFIMLINVLLNVFIKNKKED